MSCGAYGLPLVHHAVEHNMSAVYVGAFLPLFFGIAGRRHRSPNAASVMRLAMNEHWIEPLAEETPDGREQFSGEAGAYWG